MWTVKELEKLKNNNMKKIFAILITLVVCNKTLCQQATQNNCNIHKIQKRINGAVIMANDTVSLMEGDIVIKIKNNQYQQSLLEKYDIKSEWFFEPNMNVKKYYPFFSDTLFNNIHILKIEQKSKKTYLISFHYFVEPQTPQYYKIKFISRNKIKFCYLYSDL